MAIEMDKVWEIMEGESCMFVDIDDGEPRARPMAAYPDKAENAVWFVTKRDSSKVDEVEADKRVCLTFNPDSGTWLSVTGDASTHTNRDKIHEIWNDGMKAWFEGPDDPTILLIRVTPEFGEVWEGPSGVVQRAKMMFAAVTGAKPEFGENKKLSF